MPSPHFSGINPKAVNTDIDWGCLEKVVGRPYSQHTKRLAPKEKSTKGSLLPKLVIVQASRGPECYYE